MIITPVPGTEGWPRCSECTLLIPPGQTCCADEEKWVVVYGKHSGGGRSGSERIEYTMPDTYGYRPLADKAVRALRAEGWDFADVIPAPAQEARIADPETTRYTLCEDIKPGQVIAYNDKPRALVLRTNEPYTETVDPLVGRQHKAHWCRALDGSNREGWVPFGPGGQMPVEVGTKLDVPVTVSVWDEGAGEMRQVPPSEAVAGLLRYAKNLGQGTPAAGEATQRALALAKEHGVRIGNAA